VEADNAAWDNLNQYEFIDQTTEPALKLATLKAQFDLLTEEQKRDAVVVNAVTALSTYFGTLAQALPEDAAQAAAAILARQDARKAFETAIQDLPGHTNKLLQGIGIGLVALGAAIVIAIAASPLLALVTLTTAAAAIALPTAAVITGGVAAGTAAIAGLAGIFGSRSTGAHREAVNFAKAGVALDSQPEATTQVPARA
jgi:hypothetical protein